MTQRQTYESPSSETTKLTRAEMSIIAQQIAEEVMEMLLERGVMMNTSQVEEYNRLKAMQEERLIKGVEVARLLNCSPALVTKMRKEGRLRSYLQGHSAVYKLSEVLKLRTRKSLY